MAKSKLVLLLGSLCALSLISLQGCGDDTAEDDGTGGSAGGSSGGTAGKAGSGGTSSGGTSSGGTSSGDAGETGTAGETGSAGDSATAGAGGAIGGTATKADMCDSYCTQFMANCDDFNTADEGTDY